MRAQGASGLYNMTEKAQYERPGPARPETLLRGVYLSNHLTDSLAVFLYGNFIRSALVLDYTDICG